MAADDVNPRVRVGKSKQILVERICELAKAKAEQISGVEGLRYKEDGNVWWVPCPLEGRSHNWEGNDPQAWFRLTRDGDIICGCRGEQCAPKNGRTNDDASYVEAKQRYTEDFKAALDLDEDDVLRGKLGYVEIRHHDYETFDGRFVVRHYKYKKTHGNAQPDWGFKLKIIDPAADDTLFAQTFRLLWPSDWVAKLYPTVKHYYNVLHLYQHQLFRQSDGRLMAAYRAVVTEGEKDAETFNSLMNLVKIGMIATTLPDQKPANLAAHQLEIFAGREVVLIGDNDDAGKQSVDKWCTALWGTPSSIKVFPSDKFGSAVIEKGARKGKDKGRDLTEWVESRRLDGATDAEIARELAGAIETAQVLGTPLTQPETWRDKLSRAQRGGIRDSAGNAMVVLAHHPDLVDKLRYNLRSGEVEAIDAPWAAGIQVGSRRLAVELSAWLEQSDKREHMHVAPKSFYDALKTHVVPAHDPIAALLDVEWDGEPRMDALFTRYVPLKGRPADLVMLGHALLHDLVRKVRGDLVGQRLLVSIETGEDLDVARALMGRHGAWHRGKIGDRDVASFVRNEAILVQTSTEPVVNRQAALSSLPNIFARDVYVAERRLSSPLFIAVGTAPEDDRTKGKIDERVFRLPLDGRARLDDLSEDAGQIIAEAAARLNDLNASVPDKNELATIDQVETLAHVSAVVRALWDYVNREVESVDLLSPRAMRSAPKRVKPREYVIRQQFIDVMRTMLALDFREIRSQERAFNAMCHAFKWAPKLGLTKRIADELDYDIGNRQKAVVVGILLQTGKLEQLEAHLFPAADDAGDDDPFPPTGGRHGDETESEPVCRFAKVSQPVCHQGNPGGLPGLLEPLNRTRDSNRINGIESNPHAHTSRDESKKETAPAWLEGEDAVAAVNVIFLTPGVAAIDFETYPPSPKWVGDDAVADLTHGKGPVREEAVLGARKNGRARGRRACTIQVAHEHREPVFCFLDDSDHDDKRKDQLRRMFEPITTAPWDDQVATLVAHNAQFETEVLLKHGVAVDIDCTMLAAKALRLVAVRDDQPQPVDFSLAGLVRSDLGRERDKTIRDRDWRERSSLDDEAIEYGKADVRDCLTLWLRYKRELRAADLFTGYQVMQQALLPTAATNLTGLALDTVAHGQLMARMQADATNLAAELDQICNRQVINHGSAQQVGTWIMEVVLETRIRPAVAPKLLGLVDFLCKHGGLKPRADLKAMPKRLLKRKGGMNLEAAADAAAAAGYPVWSDSELVRLIEADLCNERVLTVADDPVWQAYQADARDFDQLHKDDQYRLSRFIKELAVKTGGAVKRWKTTENGHLAITKGTKARMAELLAGAFPVVSRYLLVHARWSRATKLLDSFGANLLRWQDSGRCCGQFKVWQAWTGRQGCSDPNLQNQPRDPEFRALWVAPPGRKLVIADYGQIELRILAVESGDEVLRQIYRDGRDIHAEIAMAAFDLRPWELTKEARTKAKAISFGIAYGSGASGLAEHGGFSLEEARELLERVLTAYPGLRSFRDDAPARAAKNGWIDIRPNRRVRYNQASSSATQAINAPIQGGAASVQMIAMRLIYDELTSRPDLEAKLCASVHDEFLVEAPDDDRAEAVRSLLVDRMGKGLLAVYPEAADMGMAQLTEAAAVGSWAEKL